MHVIICLYIEMIIKKNTHKRVSWQIKHNVCGAWCKCKTPTLEQNKKHQQYYHDVEKEATLYKQLTSAVVEFITKECLLESCHPFDTQTNEAMIMLVMKIYKYKFAELCEYCSWCSGVGV